MSIYSGFATRQLETSYNKAVFATLYIIQKALSRFIIEPNQSLNKKELKTLNIAFTKMSNLELRKQLQPKFSQALKNLEKLLKLGQFIIPQETHEEDSVFDNIQSSVEQNSYQEPTRKKSPF